MKAAPSSEEAFLQIETRTSSAWTAPTLDVGSPHDAAGDLRIVGEDVALQFPAARQVHLGGVGLRDADITGSGIDHHAKRTAVDESHHVILTVFLGRCVVAGGNRRDLSLVGKSRVAEMQR